MVNSTILINIIRESLNVFPYAFLCTYLSNLLYLRVLVLNPTVVLILSKTRNTIFTSLIYLTLVTSPTLKLIQVVLLLQQVLRGDKLIRIKGMSTLYLETHLSIIRGKLTAYLQCRITIFLNIIKFIYILGIGTIRSVCTFYSEPTSLLYKISKTILTLDFTYRILAPIIYFCIFLPVLCTDGFNFASEIFSLYGLPSLETIEINLGLVNLEQSQLLNATGNEGIGPNSTLTSSGSTLSSDFNNTNGTGNTSDTNPTPTPYPSSGSNPSPNPNSPMPQGTETALLDPSHNQSESRDNEQPISDNSTDTQSLPLDSEEIGGNLNYGGSSDMTQDRDLESSGSVQAPDQIQVQDQGQAYFDVLVQYPEQCQGDNPAQAPDQIPVQDQGLDDIPDPLIQNQNDLDLDIIWGGGLEHDNYTNSTPPTPAPSEASSQSIGNTPSDTTATTESISTDSILDTTVDSTTGSQDVPGGSTRYFSSATGPTTIEPMPEVPHPGIQCPGEIGCIPPTTAESAEAFATEHREDEFRINFNRLILLDNEHEQAAEDAGTDPSYDRMQEWRANVAAHTRDTSTPTRYSSEQYEDDGEPVAIVDTETTYDRVLAWRTDVAEHTRETPTPTTYSSDEDEDDLEPESILDTDQEMMEMEMDIELDTDTEMETTVNENQGQDQPNSGERKRET